MSSFHFGIIAAAEPCSVVRCDPAVWQCIPQTRPAFCGDLRVDEEKPVEVGQSLEILQTSVGDLRVAEVDFTEVGQPCEMLQTRVGDLRVADVEPFEVGQPCEMLQTSISDLRVVEVDTFNAFEKRHTALFQLRNPIRPNVQKLDVSPFRFNLLRYPLLPLVRSVDAYGDVNDHRQHGTNHDPHEMPSHELPDHHGFAGSFVHRLCYFPFRFGAKANAF